MESNYEDKDNLIKIFPENIMDLTRYFDAIEADRRFI